MATTTHVSIPALLEHIRLDSHGFLTPHDVRVLAHHDEGRLVQLLVRCGGRRFTCAAQDVEGLISAIEAVGDYLRDVSLPAGERR